MKDVLKEESEKSVIGKLLKHDKGYSLIVNNVEMAIYNGQRQERPLYSLLKKNCDEIFGITDVEELSKISFPCDYNCQGDELDYFERMAWIKGFNKAIQLNKEKLFTVEDMYEAIRKAKSYDKIPNHEGIIVSFNYLKEEIIQSLQQPTEIEVEIRCYIGNGNKESDSFKDPLVTNTGIPKLDENGCLILKKK
jgi:hypothetical protein